MNITENATSTLTLPASCVGGSCSAINGSTTASGLMVTESCTGTTTCSCTVTVSGTATLAGTYTTNADMVTITQTGQASSPLGSYCVHGNELDLFASATGPGSSMGTFSVFEKQ
jgi:hypothetical protein